MIFIVDLFQRVVLNKYPVYLYSQNHPQKGSINDIAADIQTNGHYMIHLTGHIRRENREYDKNTKGNIVSNFAVMIAAVREKCGLPPLLLPPLRSKSRSRSRPRAVA